MKNIFLTIVFCFSSYLLIAQLQLRNDEFNNASFIANWSDINATEGWGIQQLDWFNIDNSSPEQFQIVPITSSWFQEWKGALLYKLISGDFVVTTEVFAHSRSSDNRPTSQFSLAGIMVREPLDYTDGINSWQADEQNYVFISAGTADGNCSGPCQGQLEVKNTITSDSELTIENLSSNHVQIRIARISNAIITLYRVMPTETWTLFRRFDREDFPDTLQVGFTTYTDWQKVNAVGYEFHNVNELVSGVTGDPAPGMEFNPDLIADFEFYRLNEFVRPASLITADFTSQSEVSDAILLSLLNYESVEFCPERFDIVRDIIDIPFIYNRADTITISSTLSATNHSTFLARYWEGRPSFEVLSGATLQVEGDGCN